MIVSIYYTERDGMPMKIKSLAIRTVNQAVIDKVMVLLGSLQLNGVGV